MVVEAGKGRTGGRLYVVGTPIGNLGDLSARAAAELLELVRERGEMRGEMVLVVAPPSEDELELHEAALAAGAGADAGASPDDLLTADIAEALAAGEPANAIAKRLSQKYSRKKRDVYNLVLATQAESD